MLKMTDSEFHCF